MTEQQLEQLKREKWKDLCEHILAEHNDDAESVARAESFMQDLSETAEFHEVPFTRETLMGAIVALLTIASQAMADLMETGDQRSHVVMLATKNVAEIALLAAERRYGELTNVQTKLGAGSGSSPRHERAQLSAGEQDLFNQIASAYVEQVQQQNPPQPPPSEPPTGFYL